MYLEKRKDKVIQQSGFFLYNSDRNDTDPRFPFQQGYRCLDGVGLYTTAWAGKRTSRRFQVGLGHVGRETVRLGVTWQCHKFTTSAQIYSPNL